jgi:hypothetical protein
MVCLLAFNKKFKTKSFTDGEIHDYYTAEPLKNKKKDLLDQTANIIRETSDDYQKAFFKIMYTLKKFNKLITENKLQNDQRSECFTRLNKIYCLFGGFEYKQAFKEANEFFNGIYQD